MRRIQKQAGKLMWADELLRGVEGWAGSRGQEGEKALQAEGKA